MICANCGHGKCEHIQHGGLCLIVADKKFCKCPGYQIPCPHHSPDCADGEPCDDCAREEGESIRVNWAYDEYKERETGAA